jgi:hypothetical protein
MESTDFADDPS